MLLISMELFPSSDIKHQRKISHLQLLSEYYQQNQINLNSITTKHEICAIYVTHYLSLLEDDAMEETGWKLVHGDVFRPPRNPRLFVSLIGSGIQIFCCTGIVIGK